MYYTGFPFSLEKIEKKSKYLVSLTLRKLSLLVPKEFTQSLPFFSLFHLCNL